MLCAENQARLPPFIAKFLRVYLSTQSLVITVVSVSGFLFDDSYNLAFNLTPQSFVLLLY